MVYSTCPAQWLLQRPWSHRAEQSPRHHCLVSRTVRHPYPPVLVRTRGGDSHPKANSSFSEHKADVFNSILLQKAQSGPFLFLPQRCCNDKSRQKPCARKTPWQGASSCHTSPTPACSDSLPDQEEHTGTGWHSQWPRSP